MFDVHVYDRLCGTVEGSGTSAVFRYAEEYSGPPLSLSMRNMSPDFGHKFDNWATNLLPDDPEVLFRYAETLDVANTDDSVLMCARIGFDLPGTVEIYEGKKPHVTMTSRRLSEEGVADLLTSAKGNMGEGYSIGGYQSKIALRKEGDTWFSAGGSTPTTHILKPSMSIHRQQVHGELFAQQVARIAGFEVAHTEVLSFAGFEAVVSTRYDRESGGVRVHQEDFCQALGLPSRMKYPHKRGNVPTAGRIVGLADDHTNNGEEMLRRLALQAALLASDGHLKNFSFIIHDRTSNYAQLAPLYDLNSFVVSDGGNARLSIAIDEERDPYELTMGHWRRMAGDVIDEPELIEFHVSDVLHKVREAIPQAADEVGTSYVHDTAKVLESAHRHFVKQFGSGNSLSALPVRDRASEPGDDETRSDGVKTGTTTHALTRCRTGSPIVDLMLQ